MLYVLYPGLELKKKKKRAGRKDFHVLFPRNRAVAQSCSDGVVGVAAGPGSKED